MWACLEHQGAAVALLEAEYVPQAARALRKLGLAPAQADEVLGWLRSELFVREGGPLLEKYFLDGLTIDDLAELHGVHRATAARRVAAAREALVTGVKRALTTELSMGEQSVEQVITLANLDESLSQLLRRTG